MQAPVETGAWDRRTALRGVQFSAAFRQAKHIFGGPVQRLYNEVALLFVLTLPPLVRGTRMADPGDDCRTRP